MHRQNAGLNSTLINQPAGNRLLLYFRTGNIATIKQSLDKIGWDIEEEMHQNPNPFKKEFSFRNPGGYFLTITEYHEYEG